MALIEAQHDEVVLVGHSTGGLTASLWADARPGQLAALVLNSPWFDLGGPAALAAALRPVLGTRDPPRPVRADPAPRG